MYQAPLVQVISAVDMREKSWIHSRPNIKEFDPSEMSKVETADFGINSMAYIYLEITSSILIRELLMSFRGYSAWARTSRVLPIPETKISSEYKNSYASGVDKVKLAADSDLPQDIARLMLPITASTSYIYATDFRSLVVTLKCMTRHGGVARYYAEMIWNTVSPHYGSHDLDYYNYDTKGLSILSVSLTDEEKNQENGSSTYLGTTTTKFNASIALSAQFARHRFNFYKSTIWDVALLPKSEHGQIDLNHEISVISSMTYSSYMTMLSHRSEWLSDWGVWSSFVEAGTKDWSDDQFLELLDDPMNYLGDNLERIRRTDPNSPDPRIIGDLFSLEERLVLEGDNYIIRRWLAVKDRLPFIEDCDKYRQMYEESDND